jgi:hypothetical protein
VAKIKASGPNGLETGRFAEHQRGALTHLWLLDLSTCHVDKYFQRGADL